MLINIEEETITNIAFRNVIYTDELCQIVLMAIAGGNEIGMERHPNTTQFIRVEEGYGIAIIEDKHYVLTPGMAIIVPSNHWHNVIADPDSELKLYTIYSGEILHDEDEYEE